MENRRTRDRTLPGEAGPADTGRDPSPEQAAAEQEAVSSDAASPESVASASAGVEGATIHEELTTLNDKYLRLAAEFDNYRKRSSRERQEAGWRAQGDLVLGLLEALDDLTRFAHVDPASTDASTVVHGVEMVEKKALKSLGGHGLEVVNPVDQPFDPAFHEAVGTEPALSPEDDHFVARVYQPGYVFRRPAAAPGPGGREAVARLSPR